MADDEPRDPLIDIRENCGKKSCGGAYDAYKACEVRIEQKGYGTCEPWFFDYLTCIEHCAAPQLFKILK